MDRLQLEVHVFNNKDKTLEYIFLLKYIKTYK